MNSILPVKSRRFIKLYIRDTAALRGVRNYELLFEMFKQVNFFWRDSFKLVSKKPNGKNT